MSEQVDVSPSATLDLLAELATQDVIIRLHDGMWTAEFLRGKEHTGDTLHSALLKLVASKRDDLIQAIERYEEEKARYDDTLAFCRGYAERLQTWLVSGLSETSDS